MNLNALILAGGKSRRLGQDKSQLAWHGIRQDVHLARLCKEMGLDTYISKGHDHLHAVIEGIPILRDTYSDIGPMGGLATAFANAPEAAWLVWACDMPFIHKNTIRTLIQSRNSHTFATTLCLQPDLPEPMMAIYEPRMAAQLTQALRAGQRSLCKLLQSLPVEAVLWAEAETFINVNTPEDKVKAWEKMHSPNILGEE